MTEGVGRDCLRGANGCYDNDDGETKNRLIIDSEGLGCRARLVRKQETRLKAEDA